jgi:hypothetical protein
MSKFICEKCNKIFNKKSHYRLHINKANGCIVEDENDENYDIIYNDKIVKNIILKDCELLTSPLLKFTNEQMIISNKIILEHPIEINNYHGININNEYFLLYLITHIKKEIITIHGNVYIYNYINSPIINIYLHIQKNYKKVFADYYEIVKESNENQKDKYYDWLYNEYCEILDKSSLEASVMYLFLYKNKEIELKDLESLYQLIKDIIFINTSFALNTYLPHDFIYENEIPINITNYHDNKFIISCDDNKENKKKFNNFKIISVIPKKTIIIKK